MRYFLQFGAGLGELVTHALRAELDRLTVDYRDDSGLLIDAATDDRRVGRLGYVKNAFRVLAQAPRSDVTGSVDRLVKAARQPGVFDGCQRTAPFRTMVSIDGQLTGLPRPTRARLEQLLAERTGGRLETRGGSGSEYWVLGRRDLDTVLLGLRLTGGPRSKPARGALAPDIARLLVAAGDPRPDDVFLDPFAGSGALVTARRELPHRRATGSDLDAGVDARELPGVADGSVDAIVTDPPWGEHEELPDPDFWDAVLASFDRVLHPRTGRLVLLVSRRLAGGVAQRWPEHGLTAARSHDVLVNGHPATVLVGGRDPRSGS